MRWPVISALLIVAVAYGHAASGVTDRAGYPVQARLLGSFTVDLSPPTAILATAPSVTAASNPSGYEFTVAYQGAAGIDVRTLGNDDVRVSGPNGFDAAATLAGVERVGDGPARIATYRLTPPGGTWDSADSGTYTVFLRPRQVADAAGRFIPGSELGTFVVSLSPAAGQNAIAVAPAPLPQIEAVVIGQQGPGKVRRSNAGPRARRRLPTPFRGHHGKRTVRFVDVNGDKEWVVTARVKGKWRFRACDTATLNLA